MEAPGFASVAAVRQYLQAAEAGGVSVSAVLRTAGLDPESLENPSRRITGTQFQTLLRHLILAAADPCFGLRTSRFVQPGSYPTVGMLVMTCENLGEAIARISPYERLVGDMGRTEVCTSGDVCTLRWHCAYPDPLVRPHLVANVLASWVEYARWLANPPPEQKLGPRAIRVEAAEPPGEVRQIWEQVFGCPVEFAATENALDLDTALLRYPLRQPDAALRQTLEQRANEQLRTMPDGAPDDTVLRTRAVLHALLREGISRQDLVAERLGLTRRTLQRRLQDAGVRYQTLLDAERLLLAQHWLGESERSVADIGLHLGFAEPRSFLRAFRQWTGQSPGQWRRMAPGRD